MPLEIQTVKKIRRVLESRGGVTIKTHGSDQSSGEPDIIASIPVMIDGSLYGVTVVVECKQRGKKPTPLQYATLEKWKRSGAIAFWSDNPDEVVQIIQDELNARAATGNRTTLRGGRPIGLVHEADARIHSEDGGEVRV